MSSDDKGGKMAKGGKKGLLKSLDWSLVFFVGSLCFFAFGYGVAAVKYNLFPMHQLSRAVDAFQALNLMESESFAASVDHIDEKASVTAPYETLDPAAGKELLLVTGGPNQDAKNCPQFGCLAWIIDRSGKVLHSWPLPLDKLFSDMPGTQGHKDIRNFYPVGLQLLNDGSLIVDFHGRNVFPYTIGIARISWNGEVMWKHIDGAHHWPRVAPDGTIIAPIQLRKGMKDFRGRAIPIRCNKVVFDEGVRYYAPDGTPGKTILMMDVLLKSNYPGLLYGLRDDCDPIHINSVDVATAEVAANIPGAAAGDLLVSLREPSAIALIDPVNEVVKHIVIGRTAAQHSATFLPDGTVVVLDNVGGMKSEGGTRIERINLVDGSAQTVVPTAASKSILPFFTSDAGHVTVSPDGKRLMIALKDQSRDIEVDLATGKPLWAHTRVMDIGPFMDNGGKPVAAFFKAYGTYYISDEQARALPLK